MAEGLLIVVMHVGIMSLHQVVQSQGELGSLEITIKPIKALERWRAFAAFLYKRMRQVELILGSTLFQGSEILVVLKPDRVALEFDVRLLICDDNVIAARIRPLPTLRCILVHELDVVPAVYSVL